MSNSQSPLQSNRVYFQDQSFILERLTGNPFETGLQIGKNLRQHRQWIRTSPPTEPDNINLIQIRDYLTSVDPALLEEIVGLATGLRWNFSDALVYFTGWNVMRRMKWFRQGSLQACTHFFLPALTVLSADPYLCRNFDFFYNSIDHLFFEVVNNSKRIPTAGTSHQILGRADGINKYGVVCSNSITTSAGLPPKGFSHPIMTRIILDCAHNVEEGLDLLLELPQGTSINYLLADRSGHAYVFEQAKRASAIRELNPELGLVATNHIVSEDIQDQWSRPSGTSGRRYEYLKSLLEKNKHKWSLEIIKNALRTHTPEICDHDLHKGVATLWSIIYNLKTFKVWISPGQPCINKYQEISLFPLKKQSISGFYECDGHCGSRVLQKYSKLLYKTTYPE